MTAGTYWFMAIYNTTGNVGNDGTMTRMIKYVSQPFANALPTVYPGMVSSYMGGNFNYYLVFAP